MNPIRQEFQFGDHTVVLETNRVAKQASGSVLASMGDTVVLCTAVAEKEARPDQGFFPLTVNYEERTYAAGKIPGGFFRREGRPSEKETLTCRLIDRPIRPLFPKGFMNEVQVICTVMSAERDMDPDIVSMIGASAALSLSGVPFAGPIGAARVGFCDGMYVLNPGHEALAGSMLNMVVAGTAGAVLMVESEAQELTEDQMLGGVLFAHQEMQVAIEAINALTAEAGKPKWDWAPPAQDSALIDRLSADVGQDLGEAYSVTDKQARQDRVRSLRAGAIEAMAGEEVGEGDVSDGFSKLEKSIVRERILSGEPRIDGRDLDTVRPIEVDVGLLPRTHGSAMFTRGETQAIVVTTLGTVRDAARIEALQGMYNDQFMLHYNFPPYCVGETGFMTGPKRREIGHGRLARRGIGAVLPDLENFPYTIRVVSEITESNGSSSMASVCGASLSLMDAGVPLRAPVAGVAMGLVKEGDRFAVLTDILGDEDHLGDMDFKVAGTAEGVTALQMDIKIDGITEVIMETALEKALAARLHILGEMNKVISASRESMSEYAPSMAALKVHPEKIRDIIGKGGATIKGIQEETGAQVDVEDDGTVRVYAEDRDAKDAAVARIEEITAEAEVGKIYNGKVARIENYGAFVNILPGKDGLLHISEIARERVEKVRDYLEEGQDVDVVVLDVDQRGRIRLSMKELPNYAA
ncbi:MAG: polyribonucleotide nucleotidyltransferase [Gammaproteobacteria bacterium]|nr:polyribonucleotide nucleotidyltransferase [Gammaproteobacteria bacterium]MDE0225999.1 polyribonucleotide nucleotidyltransferase [Gammaproteobacteria bacterium]